MENEVFSYCWIAKLQVNKDKLFVKTKKQNNNVQ